MPVGIHRHFKRFIKSLAKRVLPSHLHIAESASKDQISEIVRLFKPQHTGLDLVRIGGDGDGGYLVPDDFKGIKYCFSPGVSTIANFEDQLAQDYGIKSFLADASVDKPPLDNEFFDFQKKFLGTQDDDSHIKLSSWMDKKLPKSFNDDLLLQMDIEGAEFDVLIESSIETLRKFRIMVIEFHSMHMIFGACSSQLLKPLMEKLSSDFVVAHIHPNNCCGIASFKGIEVPPVFEVTFLRKDRLKKTGRRKEISLPHPLDQKNVSAHKEIIMPDIWFKD